jgi:hypothetical protein
MQGRRKKHQRYNLRQTMEQVGRELRKTYRPPKRLPRRLRVVVTELERKLNVGRSQGPQNGEERG